MRINRSPGMMLSFQGTSIMRLFIVFIVSVISVFIITGMLTALKPEYRITSSSINEWAESFTADSLIHLLGFENQYFASVLPKNAEPPKVSALAFEMATSINPEDPRSLLGRELPGFSLFDGEILVAGEGTNYTNMPMESAPPVEVLLQQRKASIENLEEFEESSKPLNPPVMTTNGKDVVYIYSTHSQESYLPQLENVTDPDQAYHGEVNVTLVGKKLAKELEEQGIGAKTEMTDFTGILLNRGWDYGAKSYDVSRPAIKEALANQKDVRYVMDIHRDALPKKHTTVTINGETFARISFVVGGEHAKFEKNQKLAKDLHHLIEKKYPGLSRGVLTKQGPGTNGKFNQDLSENAILVEFGGVHNSLDEVYRTTEAFAEVFSDFYWDAEKVSR